MASIRIKPRRPAGEPTKCFPRKTERSTRFVTPTRESDRPPHRVGAYFTLAIIFVFTIAGVIAMNLSKTEVLNLLPPLPSPGSFILGALTAWTIAWLRRERPPRPQKTRSKDIWLD